MASVCWTSGAVSERPLRIVCKPHLGGGDLGLQSRIAFGGGLGFGLQRAGVEAAGLQHLLRGGEFVARLLQLALEEGAALLGFGQRQLCAQAAQLVDMAVGHVGGALGSMSSTSTVISPSFLPSDIRAFSLSALRASNRYSLS